MDDWTNTYPDVDPPESQPTLLDQDRRAIEDRHVRARQAEAARVAELGRPKPSTPSAAPLRQTCRCRSRRRPASR